MATRGEHTCKQLDAGVLRLFDLVGKRWTGPIITVLMGGRVRYAELRRAIPGISERMLSDRLNQLSSAGLVVREVDEGPPLRVAYRLTENGAAMESALNELLRWAEAHLASEPGASDKVECQELSSNSLTTGPGAV